MVSNKLYFREVFNIKNVYTYIINVQFVNINAKFDDEAQQAVKAAVENYNSKSLIAKNPKEIVGYVFSNDGMTLQITLQSEANLPMPTKALRLLSSYLVGKTTMKKYVSSRQLFKMSVSDAVEQINTHPVVVSENEDISRLGKVGRYIKLLQKNDEASLKGIDEIDRKIAELIKED